MTYKIAGWVEIFENSETRKCRRLSWIAQPVKHDSRGYRLIMRQDPRHYLAFVLLTQVAANTRERGVLADERGQPYSPADLELLTDCPASIFEAALPALVEVGWLTILGESPSVLGKSPSVLGESPGTLGSRPDVLGSRPEALGEFPLQTDRQTDTLPAAPVGESPRTPGASESVTPKRKKPTEPNRPNAWKLWVDLHDERHQPRPAALGPDTKAGKELAAALTDEAELRYTLSAFLNDSDVFLERNGHALRHLPGRLQAYRVAYQKAQRREAAEEAREREEAELAAKLANQTPAERAEGEAVLAELLDFCSREPKQ